MRLQKTVVGALTAALLMAAVSCGNGSSSSETIPIVLSVPDSLTAAGAGEERISLEWKDTNLYEQGYRIERRTDVTDFQLIDSVPMDSTTYLDSVPVAEKTYQYRVRAFKGAITSDYSNIASAVSLHAPKDLEAEGMAIDLVMLTWNDLSGKEDGFDIQRSTDGVDYQTVDTVAADETSYTDMGLEAGTIYHYKVRAFDHGGGVSDFTDPDGTATFVIPWACAYGTKQGDPAYAMARTVDLGYVTAGNTYATSTGLPDFWLVKTDLKGDVVWQMAYGGAKTDHLAAITATQDGGFIVAGETDSFGAGKYDYWLMKLDADGKIEWQKTYGGLDNDYARTVVQTSEGGFIVAGESRSFGAGGYNAWVLKLDRDGVVEWEYLYGGSAEDFVCSVAELKDNGYAIFGHTYSFGVKKSDLWLTRLSKSGEILGQLTYGGEEFEYANSMTFLDNGGFLLTARTHSFGGGAGDAWVIKIKETGGIEWQKALGGKELDYLNDVALPPGDEFVLAGETFSFGQGEGDAWIMLLNANGAILWEKAYGGALRDHAAALCTLVDGLAATGYTYSFGAGDRDMWTLKIDPDGSIDFTPSSGAKAVDTTALVEDTTVTAAVAYGIRIKTQGTVNDTDAVVTVTNCAVNRQAP